MPCVGDGGLPPPLSRVARPAGGTIRKKGTQKVHIPNTNENLKLTKRMYTNHYSAIFQITTQDCVPSVTAFSKSLRDVTPAAVDTSALFHELSTSRASHVDRHAEDVNKVLVPARVWVIMFACCRCHCRALIPPPHISILSEASITLCLRFAQLSEILLWATISCKRSQGLQSITPCLLTVQEGLGRLPAHVPSISSILLFNRCSPHSENLKI
jgi:hypothetical protein